MRLRDKVYVFIDIVVLVGMVMALFLLPPIEWDSALASMCVVIGATLLFNACIISLHSIDRSKMKSAVHHFIVDHIVDLRRPLQGLVGIQDLFAQDATPKDADEYFEIADFCAKYLIRQLDRMQFFSELEQGTLGSRPKLSSIKAIVQNAIETALEQSNNRDVTITEHWDGSLQDEILVDDRILTKALAEGIDNAIRYGGGYRVVLNVSRDPMNEKQIVFSISDHGPGLTSEQTLELQKKVKSKPGTMAWDAARNGLGLYLIRRLSHMLGGTVNVESEKGRGARLTLFVPVETVSNSAIGKSHVQTHRRPLNALVVDDDLITLRVVSAILSALDVTVISVSSGQAAIMTAQKNCFDVIFMDIDMPIMNGWQASKIILNDLALHNRPYIVALTSYCRQEDYDHARAFGLFDLVAKPAHLEQIKRVLAQIYEARDLMSSTAMSAAMPSETAPSETAPSAPPAATHGGPLLNLFDLNNHFGGDMTMCRSILSNAAAVFAIEADRVAMAISRHDSQQLSQAIHKMQGEFAVILCSDGTDLCRKISAAVDTNNWEVISQSFEQLAELVERLLIEIDATAPPSMAA